MVPTDLGVVNMLHVSVRDDKTGESFDVTMASEVTVTTGKFLSVKFDTPVETAVPIIALLRHPEGLYYAAKQGWKRHLTFLTAGDDRKITSEASSIRTPKDFVAKMADPINSSWKEGVFPGQGRASRVTTFESALGQAAAAETKRLLSDGLVRLKDGTIAKPDNADAFKAIKSRLMAPDSDFYAEQKDLWDRRRGAAEAITLDF